MLPITTVRWVRDRPTLAGSSPTRLNLGTARVAADTLPAFQDKRRQYESTNNGPRGSPPTSLNLGTARVAADTLPAFQDKRRQYESTNNGPRGSPPTSNHVPA